MKNKKKINAQALAARLIDELKRSHERMSKLRLETENIHREVIREEERMCLLMEEFEEIKSGKHPVYN